MGYLDWWGTDQEVKEEPVVEAESNNDMELDVDGAPHCALMQHKPREELVLLQATWD